LSDSNEPPDSATAGTHFSGLLSYFGVTWRTWIGNLEAGSFRRSGDCVCVTLILNEGAVLGGGEPRPPSREACPQRDVTVIRTVHLADLFILDSTININTITACTCVSCKKWLDDHR